MSEYQYYEFLTVDRPLSEADRKALRQLSTRAQITATSFINTYEWGEFKGDPAKLMDRWFDLHLYLANWGSRQLMIRLPARMVERQLLDSILKKVECAELRASGDNLILTISRDEVESDEDWDDGSGRLAALTPLRAEVLAGDLRLFYLLWLMMVEADALEADEPEPMPGIGPMTAGLEAFVEFFCIDADLVQAAAERSAVALPTASDSGVVQQILSALTDREKTGMLARLFNGDAHVQAELRARVRTLVQIETGAPPAVARTVDQLRARARAIGLAREQAIAKRLDAEGKRQAKEAEKARRARLVAIAERGESVWREIETEIERRNAGGYQKAIALLADLRDLANERGMMPDFEGRLSAIRERHSRKERFVERLAKLAIAPIS